MACTGKCKAWIEQKGFGFIEYDGGEDVFVHRLALVGAEALTVGDVVQFDVITDDPKNGGRPKAENVTGGTGSKGAGKGGWKPPTAVAPAGGSQQGVVKRWNDEKGFGFIETEGMEDIFVHRADLIGAEGCQMGDHVSYERTHDDAKGKDRATSVRGGSGQGQPKGQGKGGGGYPAPAWATQSQSYGAYGGGGYAAAGYGGGGYAAQGYGGGGYGAAAGGYGAAAGGGKGGGYGYAGGASYGGGYGRGPY